MANTPGKIRLPQIITPWEPPANTNDENTRRYLTNALRGLERDKQSGADFVLSGTTEGDILVADGALVYRPRKTVPFSFGVGTNLSVTGNLVVTGAATVTGNVALGGTLGVSGLTTIGGALNVSGAAVVVGNHSVQGNLIVTGNASLGGDILLGSAEVQCRVTFGASDNLHPMLVTFGSALLCYLADNSGVAPFYSGELKATGPLSSDGVNSQVLLYRRDTNMPAWALFSPAGTCSFYDHDPGAVRVTLGSGTSTTRLRIDIGDAGSIGQVVAAAASQAANIEEWRKSDATVYGTVSENGYFTTRKVAAPADGELSSSEAAYWLDDTNGAAKFMIKAKSANGTVVTGSVVLA